MKKVLLAVVLAVILTGCKYEDTAAKIKELNNQYCAETNAEKRKLILAAIRLAQPLYPEDGICGFEEKVKNFVG